MKPRPLTDRDLQVLSILEYQTRNGIGRPRWVTPMYIDSQTLAKLARRGLVQRRERGGQTRRSLLYRITTAGLLELTSRSRSRARP